MKIAICDDDKIMVDKLKRLTENYFKEKNAVFHIKTFIDSKELSEYCKKECLDLLLLDIDMPNPTGFEIARELRDYNHYITIIFITNREDFVFDSFEFQPFAFIQKDKIHLRLEPALDMFRKEFQKKHVLLEFDTDKGNIAMRPADMMFFCTVRHDIFLYTSNNECIRLSTRKYTLNKLEIKLQENGFIRIHKSYLLNYAYIYQICETNIKLKNEQLLPISRKRSDEVKNRYQILLRGEKI